jgi:hypothetical protein
VRDKARAVDFKDSCLKVLMNEWQVIPPELPTILESGQYTIPLLESNIGPEKGDSAMGGPAQYVQVGFILISLANLIVIALLIVVFALAVTLRRPEKSRISTIEAASDSSETVGGQVADVEVRT